MRVAVVYESLFGNTREIAEAIAEGVRDAALGVDVRLATLTDAPAPGADLLVVGGPTHFLGMASERSHRMRGQFAGAAVRRRRPDEAAGPPGMREWLGALARGPAGARAAAFDTRLDTLAAGGAARRIAAALRDRGYTLIARPEGFVVQEYDGPLRAGERDRARAWGAGLARALASQGGAPA